MLVNVAGILRDRMIFNMSEQEWDDVIRVHLKGTFNTSKFAAAHWRSLREETAQNRIINFTSVSGLHGAPGQPNYAAAKMGIVGLTWSCANSLGKYGVTCNAVSPGAATRMTDSIPTDRRRTDRPSDEDAQALARQRRHGRRLPGQRALRLADRPDRALVRLRGLPVQQHGARRPADRAGAMGARRPGRAGRAVVPADRRPAGMTKPVPEPTPETQPFWDGCARGELMLQRCRDCGKPYFYPRPICPACGSTDVEWFTASGQATLYSYVINHRPARGFEDDGPYAIAVVELAEGPRMMTNIVGVPNTPEDLILDMALQVTFEQRGDISLPVFAPAGEKQ